MSAIAYFWQSLPCWLIWDKFQVVTSWAELAQLKSGGDFGVSGSDPPPLKMSVIAYFWQSWSCWLIWNRFQVVTSWAELAHIFHTYFGPPKRTHLQGSGRRSFPCLSKYANHCWPYQNLLPFQLGVNHTPPPPWAPALIAVLGLILKWNCHAMA